LKLVRQNAASAALAAACLLFFGFFYLSKPTGTDFFSLGNLVFYYVLRVGGVAMAGISLWSCLGRPIVLMVDAVVSVAIGAMFIVSSVMMLLDGGWLANGLLVIIFGALFISSGIRNGRAYLLLDRTRTQRVFGSSVQLGLHAGHPETPAQPPAPSGSLAGELLAHSRGTSSSAQPDPSIRESGTTGASSTQDHTPAEMTTSTLDGLPEPADELQSLDPVSTKETDGQPTELPRVESSPEGSFLASFAPKDEHEDD